MFGEERWKLPVFLYLPLFHHCHWSQEQEFSGGLGVWKIQNLPSILGSYVRLLSVPSGTCHFLY